MPLDTNRLEQFKNTKLAYDEFPEVKEFVMPTRSYEQVYKYLDDNELMKDIRLIPYTHEKGYNPSKALNIGAREAKYDNLIVSSPEVKPITPILTQLTELAGQNVICAVTEQGLDGSLVVLVESGYRTDTPAMYFMAMFNKADVEKINGWDEDFMLGYAYEDNDFGDRFMRAGLKFIVRDDIRGLHQYHPRSETIPGGLAINLLKYHDNTDRGVVECKNGLVML